MRVYLDALWEASPHPDGAITVVVVLQKCMARCGGGPAAHELSHWEAASGSEVRNQCGDLAHDWPLYRKQSLAIVFVSRAACQRRLKKELCCLSQMKVSEDIGVSCMYVSIVLC